MLTELPQQAEIEAAIARVLQAERDAETEVARCKAECADTIARSRRRSEEIAARADRRIAVLNRRRAEAIERQIAELDTAPPRGAGAGKRDADTAELVRAAEALARELTGA